MIDIEKVLKNEKLLKSLTGVSKEKFEELLLYFDSILNEERAKAYKNNPRRKRREGGGAKGKLKSTQDKLFYILFYVKVYPTFEVAGTIFDVNRSQTNRWVHKYLPILEKALGKKVVLPQRKIESVEDLMKIFPNVKDIFIDSSERGVQHSLNSKE